MSGANDNAVLSTSIEVDIATLERQLSTALKSFKKTTGEIEGVTARVEQQVSKMFDTKNSAGNYRQAMRGAVQTTKQFASVNALAGIEIKKLQDQRNKGLINERLYTKALEHHKKVMFEASTAGVEAAKKQEILNAAIKRGGALAASAALPTEKYAKDVADLDRALKAGKISQETYNRAVAKAKVQHLGAAKAANVQASAYARLGAALKSTTMLYAGVAVAMAALYAAGGVKAHLDDYSSIRSQLKLIVGENGNVESSMQKVYDLSKETRGSFDGTVNAYARISRSVKQLNKSEADRLQVVSNINKAMAIGGTKTQEAQSAIQQLGQGLASGRLAGDELKSILENAPRMGAAIAEGLGVPLGKLREMGAAGELNAQRVFDALLSQTSTLNLEFENVAKTIDQSMLAAGGAVTLTTGKLDEMYGISQTVVAGFDGITSIVESIPQHMSAVEIALGGVAGMMTAAVIPAIYAMGVAALASPLLPLILAGAALGAGFVILNQVMSDSVSITSRLANLDLSLAKTTDIATKAQYGLTKALRQRGREMASLDITNSLSVMNDAKSALSGVESKIFNADQQISSRKKGSKFSEAIKKERLGYVKEQKILATKFNETRKLYEKSYSNLGKIDNAPIVDFSGGVGSVDIGGNSKTSLAKKRATEVKRIIESIKTPFAKHADRAKTYKAMLKSGELNKKQHDQALKNSIALYKRNQKSVVQGTKKYQLQKQANALLAGNLTTKQQLANKVREINDLKKSGVLTDVEAQKLIKSETEKSKKSTGKGGKSGSKGAEDKSAMALIGEHGSAMDKARAATLAYNTEMAKLNKLLREGKIDQETYNNAAKNIEGVYERAKGAVTDFSEVTKTIMGDVKSTLKGAFSDIRKGTFDLASTMDKLLGGIFDKVMGLALDGIFASIGFGGKTPIGKKDGGYIQAFANGGSVRGAGTGRSDSVKAYLSAGEFVVNERATSKYRGLLEQINNGKNVAFAKQQAVNQNINISQQPIVKMNITINNAPPNMQVTQNENGLEIDFIEQIENGLAQRWGEGQSGLRDVMQGTG